MLSIGAGPAYSNEAARSRVIGDDDDEQQQLQQHEPMAIIVSDKASRNSDESNQTIH